MILPKRFADYLKRMEFRKGKEKRRNNFDLASEAEREANRTPTNKKVVFWGPISGRGKRAFGTSKEVRGAKPIGTIQSLKGNTYWHIDRRKKHGTPADRRPPKKK